MNARVYALLALALVRSALGVTSAVGVTSGATSDRTTGATSSVSGSSAGVTGGSASSTSGSCPAECVCGFGDGGLEYDCRVGDTKYSVTGMLNDYAMITCKQGDLDPSTMPLIPLSENGTFNDFIMYSCRLSSSLARVLASAGASGALSVTLNAPRGALTAAWFDGVVGIETLIVLRPEDLHRVPWDVLDALPALSDFRLRQAQLSPEGMEAPPEASPGRASLRSLELSLSAARAPPRASGRLARVALLSLFGNDIQDITNDTFVGLSNVQTLDLSRNPLRVLRARSLASLPRLRELTLVAVGLREISTDAFAGNQELETIQLKSCTYSAGVVLRARALWSLRALSRLTVERCPLAALPADLLHGSAALQELKLTGCRLAALPAGLFRDQRALLTLDLRHNALAALPADALRPLRALRSLVLDDNRIQELPDHLLSGLVELRNVSCERNGLTRVAPTALQGAYEMEWLSLAENRLTFGTESVSGDGYLSLESQGSPFQSLPRLRTLNLRANKLASMLDEFRWVLLQLRTLDLSYNNFTRVTSGDLSFLGSKLLVNLTHNRISSVEAQEPSAADKGNVMLLDDNPFRCDCNLYSFITLLESPAALASDPRLDPGRATCASPPSLAGRPLRTLPSSLLTCPLLPKHCPHNCSCLMRPATSALELDCSEEPTKYPNPEDFGLTQTHLRLQRVKNLRIPPHVTFLNISGAGLEEPPPLKAIEHVKELDLSGNRLTAAPIQLLSSNLTLHLKENPFKCDCSHYEDIAEMQKEASKVLDRVNVTCWSGEPVWNVAATRLCDVRRASILGGTLAALGILAVIIAGLFYRYMLEIKLFLFSRGWCGSLIHEDEVDRAAQYDAFVSFSQEDARWVSEKLVPVLEDECQFKLCVHYRDWVVGDMIPAQIARSVEESRRTVVVLSQSFLKSTWALLEFRAANERAQREKRARVLIIVLGDLPDLEEMDAELRAYLNTNTYLKWGDPWFWEKLRYAMPHKKGGKSYIPDKLKRGGLNARLTEDGKIVNDSLSMVKSITVDR